MLVGYNRQAMPGTGVSATSANVCAMEILRTCGRSPEGMTNEGWMGRIRVFEWDASFWHDTLISAILRTDAKAVPKSGSLFSVTMDWNVE